MSSNATNKSGTFVLTENPPVLVSTKTYKWRFWYIVQEAPSWLGSVTFPGEASPGVPSMTVKLSLRNGFWDNRTQLLLTYDLHANEEGDVCPTYKARISAEYDGAPKIIHESALQNTVGSWTFPLNETTRNTLVNFIISFDFYCNRDIGAINFNGDTWNERHQSSRTVDMLESGLHSDVKIISSEGKEFHAHKCILRAKNEVFDAMFRNDMEESKTGVVRLDDMSAKAVKFLLHFIYSTQTLRISSNENDGDGRDATIAEVLYLADKFALIELKNYLDENLEKFCNKENAWNLFKLCKLHSLEKGRKVIYEFMKENNAEFLHEFVFAHA